MELTIRNIIDCKTNRQYEEWQDNRLNSKLKWLIESLACISWGWFEKRIIITDIYRTQIENNKIYGDNFHYSVHTFFRGIDIRISHYTEDEIRLLVNIANQLPYDKKRPKLKTAIFGDKNHLDHIHTQVNA